MWKKNIENHLTMVTTSRKPSNLLKKFVKKLLFIFPNSREVYRNNLFLSQIINKSLLANYSDIFLVYEKRGRPNILIMSHLPNGPSLFLGISKEIQEMESKHGIKSGNSPYVVFENLNTTLGKKIKNIFRLLFLPPKDYSNRLVLFAGHEKWIIVSNFFVRHESSQSKPLYLTEIGCKLKFYPIKITLGLIDDIKDVIEWKLNRYMRNSSKRNFF